MIRYLDINFLEFLELCEFPERDVQGDFLRPGLAPYDFREPSPDIVCATHAPMRQLYTLDVRYKDVLSSLRITALSRGLSSPSALAARACRPGSTSGGSFVVVAAPSANALPFVGKLRFVRWDAREAERCASPPAGASGENEGFSGGN